MILTFTLGFCRSFIDAAELGMDAPELDVAKFIKGDPVSIKAGKGSQVTVVEFWATWCGPCKTSIPHLSELQAKYKDRGVTIIGVSSETEAKVRPFVQSMGSKMDYTVAVDDNRSTFKRYMTAFNQSGIPTAFIVDKAGKLVWFGHPMSDLDGVLEQVVEGRFDLARYKVERAKADAQRKAMGTYLNAIASGEPDKATKQEGIDFVNDSDSPQVLNQFAWIILTHSKVQYRDLPLALTAAKKAYDLTEGNNTAVTDTYARALWDSGQKDEAIQFQREAVNREKNGSQKAQLEKVLNSYLSSK